MSGEQDQQATAGAAGLSDHDLRVMAAKAANLAERIQGVVEFEEPDRFEAFAAERRLERWSEQVARADEDRFSTRLELDGLDAEAARRVVGPARWPDATPLPTWTAVVRRAVELAPGVRERLHAVGHGRPRPEGEDPAEPADAVIVPGDPVPIEEFSLPFVLVGREMLRAAAPRDPEVVDPAVITAAERTLLRQVGSISSEVLAFELSLRRQKTMGSLGEIVARANPDGSRVLYDQLMDDVLGGLGGFLAEYAALARSIGVMVESWVEATAEFLTHLHADQLVLAEAFGGGQSLGTLVSTGGAESDPHRGRRRVVGCRFANGTKIVYKPKSLRTESAFNGFIEWLNGKGFTPPLRALKVCERDTYGWVSFAEFAPVADREAAERYFTRAGGLLALVYGLGGNDCHAENLVAAGEDPVLVDAETILHPTIATFEALGGEAPGGFETAAKMMGNSVLTNGLLPAWLVSPEGRAFDISGLGARGRQLGLEPMLQWELPNTDLARLAPTDVWVGPFGNEVRLDGVTQYCEDYTDQILAGFEQAYELLRAGRDELTAPGGPLDVLADAVVRVLFRATRTYAKVANASVHPDVQRFGLDRSLVYELLRRPLLDADDPRPVWPLATAEIEAMENTDVPYLAVSASSGALTVVDPVAGGVAGSVAFESSALDSARKRLGELSATDREYQRKLAQTALSMTRRSVLLGDDADHDHDHEHGPATPAEGDPLTEAVRLGEELAEAALRGEGTGLAWIGLTLGDEAEGWQLAPTGWDYYTGTVGIAVFFAALARVTGDARWTDLTVETLGPVPTLATANAARLAAFGGIGAGGGAGGLLLALLTVGRLIDRPDLAERAAEIGRAIRPSAIEGDTRLDLMGGAAGLALGLVATYRATGDGDLLEVLRIATRRLLDTQRRRPPDAGAWATLGGSRLAGASHGASGMALALARAHGVLDDPDLRQAVVDALAFETSVIDPERDGWPDLRDFTGATARATRDATRPPVLATWCHGAPGIGEVRLALRADPDFAAAIPTLDEDIARAVRLSRTLLPGRDHLCCGITGAHEFLLDAAAATGDASLAAEATTAVRRLAGRLAADVPLRLNRPAGTLAPMPSLFQGTAGVGYGLLRAVDPTLPSLLAWDGGTSG